MVLKHAHKLMNPYTQQLATFNKHRGKGQQKVTVEHVNVHAGGQAIVGNVETGASAGGAGSHKIDIRPARKTICMVRLYCRKVRKTAPY